MISKKFLSHIKENLSKQVSSNQKFKKQLIQTDQKSNPKSFFK